MESRTINQSTRNHCFAHRSVKANGAAAAPANKRNQIMRLPIRFSRPVYLGGSVERKLSYTQMSANGSFATMPVKIVGTRESAMSRKRPNSRHSRSVASCLSRHLDKVADDLGVVSSSKKKLGLGAGIGI